MPPLDLANTSTALVGDGEGSHAEPWVGFDYDAIDAKAEVKELQEYPLAAEGMHKLLQWIWEHRSLGNAFRKFVVISAVIDPKLVDGASLPALAKELGCTKAALSKISVHFADAFGVRFRNTRTKTGRKHMKEARLRQTDANGHVLGRRFKNKKGAPVESAPL